jgi:1-acyl-sn-glycerol-3-phosphate acyltransferase
MNLKHVVKLARIYARIFYGYEEDGVENIPFKGPCIFGFNHPGKLLADMFAALAIIPNHQKIPLIVAPQGMFQGGGGQFSRGGFSRGDKFAARLLRMGVSLAPTVGISRRGDSSASQNMVMLKELENGGSVLLSVEGEVSWDGRPNPARPGAPWMALRSGAPFVPVAVTGSYDVWPRWESNPKLTGKIIVRVGKPFRLVEKIPEWIDDEMIVEAGEKITREIDRLTG